MPEVVLDKAVLVPIAGTYLAKVKDFTESKDDTPEKGNTEFGVDLEDANIITSLRRHQWDKAVDENTRQHSVLVDLDVPCKLLPSSTQGHWHLYVERPVTWSQYIGILAAFANAGIVEQGYLEATIRRGWGGLRLPWVRKDEPEPHVVDVDARLRALRTQMEAYVTEHGWNVQIGDIQREIARMIAELTDGPVTQSDPF